MAEFTPVVLNPVLTFVADGLNHSTEEEVKTVCRLFYSIDELVSAKKILWAVDDQRNLGRMVNRRDSQKRSEKEQVLADIFDAITTLSDADALPPFAVTAGDLGRIPKIKPHEMLPVSAYERLASLEEQMAVVMSLCTRPQPLPAAAEEEIANLRPLPERVAHLEQLVAANSALTYAQAVSTEAPFQQQAPKPSHLQQSPTSRPTIPKVAHDIPEHTNAMHRRPTDKDGFTEANRKRKGKRPRKDRVMGALTSCKLKGAPLPTRDIYVGRLLSHYDAKDIEDHASAEGLQCLEVERLSSASAPYASFRIRVCLSEEKRAFSSHMWPTGAVIGKFYSPRLKKNPAFATDDGLADNAKDDTDTSPNLSDATAVKEVAGSDHALTQRLEHG